MTVYRDWAWHGIELKAQTHQCSLFEFSLIRQVDVMIEYHGK